MEMATRQPHCWHLEVALSTTLAAFSRALMATLMNLQTWCGAGYSTVMMHLKRVTSVGISL